MRAQARTLGTLAGVALLGLAACGGPPKTPPHTMARFDASMCPALPPENLAYPPDPTVEGAKAEISLVSKIVPNAAALRLALQLRNIGTHGITLDLPQKAFTVAGYQLVDHACRPVGYVGSPAAKALAYGNAGPMPLGIGDLATLDLALDSMAPGITLPAGIYAIRLAIQLEPSRGGLRGHRLVTEWNTFAVVPPK